MGINNNNTFDSEATPTEEGATIVKGYSIAAFETEEKANIARNDFAKRCYYNGLDSLNAT